MGVVGKRGGHGGCWREGQGVPVARGGKQEVLAQVTGLDVFTF